MATTNHVVDFLMENKSATLPEIQIRLHISYKEARSLLKQLEEDGKVTLVNDITFKLTAFIDEEEEEEEEEVEEEEVKEEETTTSTKENDPLHPTFLPKEDDDSEYDDDTDDGYNYVENLNAIKTQFQKFVSYNTLDKSYYPRMRISFPGDVSYLLRFQLVTMGRRVYLYDCGTTHQYLVEQKKFSPRLATMHMNSYVDQDRFAHCTETGLYTLISGGAKFDVNEELTYFLGLIMNIVC